MTESSALNLMLPMPPTPMPTREAIATVRREPHFKQAVAAISVSSIEFYKRRWLANRLLHDRARFGMALLGSGLTT